MLTRTAAPLTLTRTAVSAAPALDLPMVAATCPACEGHNVSDATGLGACGDCGMTDNLSAFMGGKMTARATIAPSKFAKNSDQLGAARKVRAFTISGQVD